MINPAAYRWVSQVLSLDSQMSQNRHPLIVPVFAICGLFAVSACALPPAIAIASYAATGISFLTSGKSVSDHALSAMVEKDCALFRVVMGDDICREQGDQLDDGVVVAMADGMKPWDIEPAAGTAYAEPENPDGSGDYFDDANVASAPMLAEAPIESLKGILLEGLALGTEVFALMQDDGALEIFAHDPALAEAPENMRLILKVDGYAQNSASVEGVRLNGRYFAISDILV